MILINETTLLAVLAATSLLGLVSLASIRMAFQIRLRHACQHLFFVALAAVGGSTMLCLACRHEGWLLSAITLGTMVVGATFDGGKIGRTRPLSGSEWFQRG